MKGWTPLIAIIALVLLITSFAPLATADGNSLRVVLTVPDQEYRVGQTVTVTMQIYDNGILADIGDNDTVRMWVSDHWNLNDPAPVPLTPAGVGTFTGAYVIQDDDNHLYFFHDVYVNGMDEMADENEDALHIDVSSFENTVDVNFYGQETIRAFPGDTVTATIEVRYGNDLLTPESFDDLVLIDPDGTETPLSETFVETGYYTVPVTIPSSTTESGRWGVYAHPNTGGHDTAYIQVDVLNVWYRPIDVVGDDIVQFEVGVSDRYGMPVDGATVGIERWAGLELSTTNESGLAFFSISGIGNTDDFDGFVRTPAVNQTLNDVVIYNPQGANPGHGLYIYYDGDQETYATSEPVSRQYVAYYDQDPIDSTPIRYYITAWGANFDDNVPLEHVDGAFLVVATGTATTDTLGRFSIDFTAPSTQCELRIEMEIDLTSLGGDYEEWPLNNWNPEGARAFVTDGAYLTDEDVEISTAGLDYEAVPGAIGTEVTLAMPADYDDVIVCSWYYGEVNFDSPTWMQDSPWIPWTSTDITLVKNEDGNYVGEFATPLFLNAEKVTIKGGYTDGQTGMPHYNSEIAEPGAGGGNLLLILLVVALLIVGMLFILKQFRGPKIKTQSHTVEARHEPQAFEQEPQQQPGGDTPPPGPGGL